MARWDLADIHLSRQSDFEEMKKKKVEEKGKIGVFVKLLSFQVAQFCLRE